MEMILPDGVERARKLTDWLEGRFKINGSPEFDPKSANFWEMVYDIIMAFQRGFAKEFNDWLHDRDIDLAVERALKDSVKGGFKKSVAFPPTLFKLLKAYWPQGKLQDKSFVSQFKKRYPQFRNSNWT